MAKSQVVSKDGLLLPVHWSHRFRWTIKPWFVYSVLCAYMALSVVLAVIVFYSDPNVTVDVINESSYNFPQPCGNSVDVQYILIVQGIVVLALCSAMVVLLWNAEDSFNFKVLRQFVGFAMTDAGA